MMTDRSMHSDSDLPPLGGYLTLFTEALSGIALVAVVALLLHVFLGR